MSSFVVCIAGGSGSGKTTFAKKLQQKLGEENCHILGQDSYYIDQSSRFDHDGGSVNFDHPDAIEFTLMAKHLRDLKNNQTIQVPIYDFATHSRKEKTQEIQPSKIVLVDGILILSQECLRDEFDLSLFISCSEETRFERRLKRDTVERGRTPEGVRKQFFNQVKPMHDEFVEPSMQYADIIVEQNEFELMLETIYNRLANQTKL